MNVARLCATGSASPAFLKQTIDEQADTIAHLASQLEDARAQHNVLSSELQHSEQSLQRLQDQLDQECQRSLKLVENQVKSDEMHASLLNDSEQQVHLLTQSLSERDQQLREKSEQLAAAEDQLRHATANAKELQRRMLELQEQNTHLTQELEASKGKKAAGMFLNAFTRAKQKQLVQKHAETKAELHRHESVDSQTHADTEIRLVSSNDHFLISVMVRSASNLPAGPTGCGYKMVASLQELPSSSASAVGANEPNHQEVLTTSVQFDNPATWDESEDYIGTSQPSTLYIAVIQHEPGTFSTRETIVDRAQLDVGRLFLFSPTADGYVDRGGVYDSTLMFESGTFCKVRVACRVVPHLGLTWTTGYGAISVANVLRYSKADLEKVADSSTYGGGSAKMKGTPLQHAVRSGRTHMVHALLEAGASTTVTNKRGLNLLMVACKHGLYDVVQLLTKQTYASKVDVNAATDDKKKVFALMFAVAYGHDEVVRVLAKHPKIMLEQRDSSGMTAFLAAAHSGQAGAIETLAEAKADVNALTIGAHAGRNALMVAVDQGQRGAVVKALLDAGVSAGYRHPDNGQNALDMAQAAPSRRKDAVVLALLHQAQAAHEEVVPILRV